MSEESEKISRRRFLKVGAGVAAAAGATGLGVYFATRPTLPPTEENPITIGLQAELTGAGSSYGAWYRRVTQHGVDFINNEMGGIADRPVKLVIEDTATDAAIGARKVRKLILEDKVDFVNGALFSNVLLASVPVAKELKTIYFANSEDYGVVSGEGNRYVFQTITDVRAQVTSIVDWLLDNVGKSWSVIFPDYAFGYYHRDWFPRIVEERGGKILEKIPVPLDAIDFLPYISRIDPQSDAVYHVIVGPSIFTFVKQLAEYGFKGEKFGFVDSIETIDTETIADSVEGWWFWEAFPRRLSGYDTEFNRKYREIVGVDAEGAAIEDSNNVSAFSHMHSVWESLFAIKKGVEESGWQSKADNKKFIEYMESLRRFDEGIGFPAGSKLLNAKNHQAFGQHFISKIESGRLNVEVRIPVEKSLYEPEVDYREEALD
jgi:branched-chain amino acid transport system substrate-binding protein